MQISNLQDTCLQVEVTPTNHVTTMMVTYCPRVIITSIVHTRTHTHVRAHYK